MTIKQQGGIFGRNPSFNDVEAESLTLAGNAVPDASTILVDSDIGVSVQGYDADIAKLDVAQTFTDAQTFRGNGTSVSLQWAADGGSQGVAFKNSAGTTLWDISGGVLERQDELAFRRQGSTVLYLDNSSNVRVSSGNLVIGTSGQGIDFSATSGTGTSELFDDYEEGSFSSDTTLTLNYTFVSKIGRYTKVGDMVTTWFRYEWTSANTGTGDTTFSALPFAATEDGYVHITECTGNIAADQIHGRVISGTSSFKIYGRNNGSATQVGPSQRSIWNGAGASNVLAGVAVYKA